jgi:GDP-mannose 6-dehydrogenase
LSAKQGKPAPEKGIKREDRRIVVIGLGHIGIVNVAALLGAGHVVVGVDRNDELRNCVAKGQSPFREPGVGALISAGHSSGRLSVTTNLCDEASADLIFVCVDTPGLTSGALDLANVMATAHDLGKVVSQRPDELRPLLLVFRSTMLPGSMREVVLPALAEAAGEAPGLRYEVAYLPEFTREGSALSDYLAPGRIVIGERPGNEARFPLELFAGIDAPVFKTSFEVAELLKFADNTFHALKISFANEIGRFALRVGIPPGEVFDLFQADTKLNLSGSYLRPGAAFGGPCLPKDLRALMSGMQAAGIKTPIIQHIVESNTQHGEFLVEEIERRAKPNSRILLLGLSFKNGTDDLRDSQFVILAQALLDRGYELSIHDPDIAKGEIFLAHLPSKLASAVLSHVSATASWDLVVVGKNAPHALQSIGTKFPVFHIDHL